MSIDERVFNDIIASNRKRLKEFQSLGSDNVGIKELEDLKKELTSGIGYIDFQISSIRMKQ